VRVVRFGFVFGLAVSTFLAVPAGAAPPPEVTIAGDAVVVVGASLSSAIISTNPGFVELAVAGTGPVDVHLSLGGDAVAGVDYAFAPTAVSAPGGFSVRPLPATSTDDVVRTQTFTVEPGADYTVGAPATLSMEIRRGPSQCARPAFTDAVTNREQTIGLGETPASLSIVFTPPVPSYQTATLEVIDGALPPGIALGAGYEFTGAATAPGEYLARIQGCLPSFVPDCDEAVLALTVDGGAGAAEAVVATPRFTG
jgi:hypothetical protein